MTLTRILPLAGVASLALITGCGNKDQAPRDSSANAPAGGSSSQVPLATRPSSDCDWIPVAEVEAIVGKLAEPPREGEDGCVYKLPIPQHVLDERAKFTKLRAALAKLPG